MIKRASSSGSNGVIRQRTRHTGSRAVTVEHRHLGEVLGREETVQPVARDLDGNLPMARVRVGGSITRNMGDFNSVRVEVVLEIPCTPLLNEVDKAYQNASRWVDQKLQRELVLAEGGEVPEVHTEDWML